MPKKNQGLIYVIDMESSLSDALARRVIDMGQYFLYRPWNLDIDIASEIATHREKLKGIIISGSAKNIKSKKHTPPTLPLSVFKAGIPILGICYGMQLMGWLTGADVVRCWKEQDLQKRTKAAAKKDPGEQGPVRLQLTEAGQNSPLFQGIGPEFDVWMKHNWMLADLPANWTHTASSELCPIAAMEVGRYYAVQFHPEPYHSLFGRVILRNFLTNICGVETPFF